MVAPSVATSIRLQKLRQGPLEAFIEANECNDDDNSYVQDGHHMQANAARQLREVGGILTDWVYHPQDKKGTHHELAVNCDVRFIILQYQWLEVTQAVKQSAKAYSPVLHEKQEPFAVDHFAKYS